MRRKLRGKRQVARPIAGSAWHQKLPAHRPVTAKDVSTPSVFDYAETPRARAGIYVALLRATVNRHVRMFAAEWQRGRTAVQKPRKQRVSVVGRERGEPYLLVDTIAVREAGTTTRKTKAYSTT